MIQPGETCPECGRAIKAVKKKTVSDVPKSRCTVLTGGESYTVVHKNDR